MKPTAIQITAPIQSAIGGPKYGIFLIKFNQLSSPTVGIKLI